MGKEKSGIPTQEDNAWGDFRRHWLSRSTSDYSYSAFKTKTIDETIELAFRQGWRSGREKLLDMITERIKTQVVKHILGGGE